MVPTISAPASAPGAEPMPPTIAAANTEMMRPAPISGARLAARPRENPAPPAGAPPPRAPRERAAAERRGGDHPLDGHALHGGEQRVVGRRAHRDAESGAAEESLRERHQRDGRAQDHELIPTDPDPGHAGGAGHGDVV